MKLLIIVCAILFLAVLLIPVDNSDISRSDPIRMIAGTSIEPRADWGDSTRHCLPYGCNI